MENKEKKQDKPLIGITLGDINGIGPELIIRILADNRITKSLTPVIYGSGRVLSYYRKALGINLNYNQITNVEEAHSGRVNILNVWSEEFEINPGTVTEAGGKMALMSLKAAMADLSAAKIDAMVTGPINKKNIQGDDFQFPGHTEYVTQASGAKESLMLMVSPELRVGMVTGHISLAKVSEAITKEKIIEKATIMDKTLKKDFGIAKPKIAIMGLNPHAGEEGLLGSEEKDIISPALEILRTNGVLAFGPFPADGFFGAFHFKKYDGVLAMYHDQGLAPFKTLAFDSGVNYTAGLSVIRTSPDHGTAYDMVGKNSASLNSFREAIYLAHDIVKTRAGAYAAEFSA